MANKAGGLRGVVVADSTASLVDGENGRLIYEGYAIEDLAANALFEEVAYLLWNERLPNRTELENLRSAIAGDAGIPDGVMAQLKAYPKDADPMAVLRTAVSALAPGQGCSGSLRRDCGRSWHHCRHCADIFLSSPVPGSVTQTPLRPLMRLPFS